MTQLHGVLMILLANVFFVGSHNIVKILSDSLPVTHMMFFRFIAGPAVMIPYVLYLKKKIDLTNKKMLFLRTFFGVTAMFFYFFALKNTDIGKATLIFNCSTIWAIILAMKLYKDTPSIQTKWAVPFAFIGLYIVLRPENFIFLTLGDGFALLASFFNAGVVISLKSLRKTNSTENVIIYNYVLSSLVVALPFSSQWVLPTAHQWLLLVSVGLIGLVGQILMTTGYKYAQASIAGSVSLISVPLMVISGWLFFGQDMDMLTLIGTSIVFLSLIVITRYR